MPLDQTPLPMLALSFASLHLGEVVVTIDLGANAIISADLRLSAASPPCHFSQSLPHF